MMESCGEWIYVKCLICEREIWSYRSYNLTQWLMIFYYFPLPYIDLNTQKYAQIFFFQFLAQLIARSLKYFLLVTLNKEIEIEPDTKILPIVRTLQML